MRGLAFSVAFMSLAALAGCGQMNSAGPTTEADYAVEEAAQGEAGRAADAPQSAPPHDQANAGEDRGQTQNGAQTADSPIRYLAYAYNVGLELPAGRVAHVMDAHAQACAQAGPRLCQIIGSDRQGDPDSYVRGALSLRAQPQWLQGFMGRLASDAENAGGRIDSQSTNTEDLTRAIVDTEARLRATRALRDRLQRLLESRPGRLSDLLEVERELARVQGEIDATQSNLAVMRTRVEMSALTISYQSSPRAVGADTFRPLKEALAGFLGFIAQSLAVIVTLVGMLIPWALLIALGVWLWRRFGNGPIWPFRRRKPPVDEAPPA
ncbi:MAG: DUF4349 domain-containing protein [Hyphomonadaceae bacterium]